MQVAHQNCVYTCPTLTQEALACALELEIKRLDTPNSFFFKMVKDLKDRRDMMSKAIKDSGMVPVIPDGGYFMMVNWKPLGIVYFARRMQRGDANWLMQFLSF